MLSGRTLLTELQEGRFFVVTAIPCPARRRGEPSGGGVATAVELPLALHSMTRLAKLSGVKPALSLRR